MQVFVSLFLLAVVASIVYILTSNRKQQRQQSDYKSKYVSDEPLPEPTPLWDLTPERLKTYDDRPWRPFRWPYHQTMSIFKLDINHWLDMDKWYQYVFPQYKFVPPSGVKKLTR